MGWELSTELSGHFAQATEDTGLASSAPGMSLKRSEVSLSCLLLKPGCFSCWFCFISVFDSFEAIPQFKSRNQSSLFHPVSLNIGVHVSLMAR